MTHGNNPKIANLIIAGVNKAGTTSLFYYLSAHPEICGSADKETCYFLPLLYDQQVTPLSEYEKQFSHCADAKYRMEATPGYVTGGEKIASAIYNNISDAKIIIILKEPVDRLISFYNRKKATLQLPADLTFNEYVNRCRDMHPEKVRLQENHLYSAVESGKYSTFIEPWLKKFKDNIKIVFFDDLKKDPRSFITAIAGWLNIDKSFYRDFNFDIKNKSMNYKNQYLQRLAVIINRAGQHIWRANPGIKKNLLSIYYKFNGSAFSKEDIDVETLKSLKQFYAPWNRELSVLLSRYGINENKPSWLEPVTIPA